MFTQRLFSKALKFRGHWQRCADRKCGTPKKNKTCKHHCDVL